MRRFLPICWLCSAGSHGLASELLLYSIAGASGPGNQSVEVQRNRVTIYEAVIQVRQSSKGFGKTEYTRGKLTENKKKADFIKFGRVH